MTSTPQVHILPLKLSPVSDNELIGLTSIGLQTCHTVVVKVNIKMHHRLEQKEI